MNHKISKYYTAPDCREWHGPCCKRRVVIVIIIISSTTIFYLHLLFSCQDPCVAVCLEVILKPHSLEKKDPLVQKITVCVLTESPEQYAKKGVIYAGF